MLISAQVYTLILRGDWHVGTGGGCDVPVIKLSQLIKRDLWIQSTVGVISLGVRGTNGTTPPTHPLTLSIYMLNRIVASIKDRGRHASLDGSGTALFSL